MLAEPISEKTRLGYPRRTFHHTDTAIPSNHPYPVLAMKRALFTRLLHKDHDCVPGGLWIVKKGFISGASGEWRVASGEWRYVLPAEVQRKTENQFYDSL